MIRLAASEPGIPVLPEDLDTDPWLLNCLNCTLDLRADASARSRPHTKSDLITKLSPTVYDPGRQCLNWLATLQLVFADNARLIRYWQQLCGLALTGVVGEQILPILYGAGRNGKSTLIGAMLGMLGGDYAIEAPQNFLMVGTSRVAPDRSRRPPRQAPGGGRRDRGGSQNQRVLVKELTGKDTIRARRMREDFWEFSPTHTSGWVPTTAPASGAPTSPSGGAIREIPFTVAIPEDRVVKDMDRRLADGIQRHPELVHRGGVELASGRAWSPRTRSTRRPRNTSSSRTSSPSSSPPRACSRPRRRGPRTPGNRWAI